MIKDCTQSWLKLCRDKYIPVSKSFSLSKTLGDPIMIRDWKQCGLPNDSFSVESALISLNSIRWPLFIDPQNQANNWIANMEKSNGLKIVSESDFKLIQILEKCVSFGQPLLIKNVNEELHPILEPILLKHIIRQVELTKFLLNLF